MRKNCTLILMFKKNDLFFQNIKGYHIENFYNPICNIKLINKIFRRLNLLKFSFCFSNWKYKIKKYENVIIFDSMYNTNISKYIKKKNKNISIKLYTWNPIGTNNAFILSDKYIDQIYSFDSEDVKKYKLLFNPMFFTKNIINESNKIKRELLFFGRAKNRKSIILKIQQYLNEIGIKNDIFIIENESEMMSYQECLTLIKESQCILDIVGPEQTGLTLRCTEALFLEKKIITNNSYIKDYDFYNSENILVINDHIDKETIRSFLKKPYKKISDDIKLRYDFDSWFERFFI